MIKSKLMNRLKEKLGGTYSKENGRWFWSKAKEKHLVTTGWLLKELAKPIEKPAPPARKVKVVFSDSKPEPKPEPTPEPKLESESPKVEKEIINEQPTS